MEPWGGSKLTALVTAAICVLGLGFAATASSAAVPERSFTVKTPHVEGPAEYDKVFVTSYGRPKAKNVLVLNPGTSASAAYFAPLARDLTSKAPGWQVWAVERRENLLEDQSVFDRAKRGEVTPKAARGVFICSPRGTRPAAATAGWRPSARCWKTARPWA